MKARIGLVTLFFLVLACRRPSSLLHADFWAEDGWRWYPDAYNQGWHSLFIPYAGYLQSICRIVGLAAQFAPLSLAPTIFAIVGFSIPVATASLLVSQRLDRVWPDRGARVGFALLYLLLPNSFEVYGNLTNCQWHLALLAFLLLVGEPAHSGKLWLLDGALLGLCGSSGPFCLFLLPVSAWQAWRRRSRNDIGNLFVLVLSGAIQASLAFSAGRGAAPDLGAGPRRFATIFALQVILGPLLGRHTMPDYIGYSWWRDGVIPVLVAAPAFALILIALRSGPALLRLFVVFSTLVFAAGLTRPATGSGTPAWVLFSAPDIGDRYYLFPMLAWIGVLFTLARHPRAWLRRTAWLLLLMVGFAAARDLHFATRLGNSPPTDFLRAARMFSSAPTGMTMSFPLRPEGVAPMVLVKH